jgi:hypothetical protein
MRRSHRTMATRGNSCSRSAIIWARPVIRSRWSRRPLATLVRRSPTALRISGPAGVNDDAGWDVVIVGAGAGGAATAYGLCQRGLSVLLLDAGPRFDPATDYPLTEADWEARDFPERPGSIGTVTFARPLKLAGNEPLLAAASGQR